MKKNLIMRFRSIRTSILVSFALLTIFALLTFLVISLKYTQDTVLENSTEYTSQLIGQVNSDIDSYITYMENISFIVANNGDVVEYLFAENKTPEEEQELRERILAVFKTVTDTREDIVNIALVSSDGRTLLNDGESSLNPFVEIEELSWYQEALKRDGDTAISSSHVQNAVKDSYDWVVTLSRSITSRITPEVEGIFFVDLNYNAINSLCEKISLGNKGYIFILDENGGIVYHPQQQLIYSGMKQEHIGEVMGAQNASFVTDDGRLYTVSRSEDTGWLVVGVAYVSELMQSSREAQAVYLLVALLLLAVALIFGWLLSNEITKPVTALEKSMKEVEKGNFDYEPLDVRDENEISRLTRNFNIMTEEIKKLMSQSVLDEQAKRSSELRALQAQINPHFLYNTLDSIIWMAEWGKNQEVVRMTSSLAKLLRRSISNEREVVTIEEEMEYTETYLTIQKMRYKDKLEYELQVEPEILRKPIVKLLLQPLVENAIYHGIKYKEGKGTIRIRGFRKEGCILIQIEDDGKGMDQETLDHIFEKHTTDTKSNGVGVKNVNERIQLYYGEEYGLSYESSPGRGTIAAVTLPDMPEGGEETEADEKE